MAILAKSCAECRRRKIKCTWAQAAAGGDGRPKCDHCVSFRRTCVPQPQTPRRQSQHASRARIDHLERELSALASLVKESHGQSGVIPTTGTDIADDEVEYQIRGPAHLRMLFQQDGDMSEHTPVSSSSKAELLGSKQMRHHWKKLMLDRQTMQVISRYASPWMNLYHALFPSSFIFRTGDQLADAFDHMRSDHVDPITLAAYLACAAVTVQQLPADAFDGRSRPDVVRFAEEIYLMTEQLVEKEMDLLLCAKGLELAMFYIRWSLGRGELRKTWVLFRRVVALAELADLPSACTKMDSSETRVESTLEDDLSLQVEVWDSICATDRNFTMMLNLPAATAKYPFPRSQSLLCPGAMSPQAYNYRLSQVCPSIAQIDAAYTQGSTPAETQATVLQADHQMRVLHAEMPSRWFLEYTTLPTVEILVQFWHFYLLARIHLRPALLNDSEGIYKYSKMVCLQASHDAVCRFPLLRPHIPSGFFICRVLDVQAFTTGALLALLILSEDHAVGEDFLNAPVRPHLIKELLTELSLVLQRTGTDMGKESSVALLQLLTVLSNGSNRACDLRVPLLGSVRLSSGGNQEHLSYQETQSAETEGCATTATTATTTTTMTTPPTMMSTPLEPFSDSSVQNLQDLSTWSTEWNELLTSMGLGEILSSFPVQ